MSGVYITEAGAINSSAPTVQANPYFMGHTPSSGSAVREQIFFADHLNDGGRRDGGGDVHLNDGGVS